MSVFGGIGFTAPWLLLALLALPAYLVGGLINVGIGLTIGRLRGFSSHFSQRSRFMAARFLDHVVSMFITMAVSLPAEQESVLIPLIRPWEVTKFSTSATMRPRPFVMGCCTTFARGTPLNPAACVSAMRNRSFISPSVM